MCDKKNSILFTKTECLVLSPDFKLIDESQVLLRVPRQNNMYCFDLKNVVPSRDLTCLFAKATIDESKIWHRRLGHVNFKTMNKLVKGNLVRGLPSKTFENDHTCVGCQKEKQHKASCKTKHVSSINQPLQMLHMDLFGLTSVRSINHKTYCLVVTDDFSRQKGIKREYSVAITPQQNGVAKRKNRTLIEAARTILNTLDPLGKFDGKAKEGFLVGYSVHSKAFRVFNTETRKVEENLHGIKLTKMQVHKKLMAIQSSDDKAEDYTFDDDACKKTIQEPASKYDKALKNVLDKMMDQEKEATDTPVNTASASRTFSPVGPSSGPSFVPFGGSFPIDVANLPHDPLMPKLEDTAEIQSTGIFGNAYDDHDLETLNTPYADQSVGAEADFNNMEPSTVVSPIPTTRVHSTHPKAQIIGDPKSAVQTRGMTKKNSGEHAMISYIQKQRRINHKDF
ncbi:ribonuclease H-like domain-containing protein [Tanacetum coccineum]